MLDRNNLRGRSSIDTVEPTGQVTIERGQKVIEDVTEKHVLEKFTLQKMSGATPSVLNAVYLEGTNTGAVNVTDFLNGSELQTIRILGDGFMTVVNGTFIFTNTGANKLLAANQVYNFTNYRVPGPPVSHKWVEDA